MSWVNLDDVYVNKSGDSIAGNLSVGGALTINDGKGTNTTYNVANEITTLRDSVSNVFYKEGAWNKIQIGNMVMLTRAVSDAVFKGGNEYVRSYIISFPVTFAEIPVISMTKFESVNSSTNLMVNPKVWECTTTNARLGWCNGSGGIPDNFLLPFFLIVIGRV